MLAHKLEKDIILYKNQFERFSLELFGSHKLDRTSIDIDALLFRIKYMVKRDKDKSKLPELKRQFTEKALELRNIFGEFMYEFLTQIIGIPGEFHLEDIEDVLAQDVKIDTTYVKFKMILISRNEKYLHYVDNAIPDGEVYNMFPNEFFRFYTDSYNDGISKAYPELFENRQQDKVGAGADADVFVHNFTFQTSERCSLNCFPAGTKVLMSDFSHKNIEDIDVGDVVLGFEEFNTYQKERSLRLATVTHTFKHMESCYRISHPDFKEDLYVTPEHPLLTGRGTWTNVLDLRPSDGLRMTTFDPEDYYDTDITSIEYIKGYFIAGFLGDGCAIQSYDKNGYLRHFMRFAVKDDEMIERMKQYADILGFTFNIRPFKISEKFNLIKDCLVIGRKEEYDRWKSLVEDSFKDKSLMKSPEFLMGFAAGLYDAEGSIDGSLIRIHNSDMFLLGIVEDALRFLNIKWDYDKPKKPVNKLVYTLRTLGGSAANLKFIKSTNQCINRKGVSNFIGKSLFRDIYGYSIEYVRDAITVYNIETTEKTYIANRLMVHNCTYCYQMNKTNMRMDFNVAKKFIDELLADKYGYINRHNSPAIIIEFIGGEPLLEIKLTRKIYEYFLDQCYELNHPWFTLHRLSICSNGLQYFDEDVQDFFKEYAQNVSFNISIDGNKELHDACRIQPNGEGSYDIDMMALNHYNRHYTPERNSKMTLAPENMKYLFDSVVNFIDNGMTCINLNCIFEEGWNQKTALLEYQQLKQLADYLIDRDLEHLYIAIFNERQEDMQSKHSDGNFCFKAGTSVATPDGNKLIEDLQIGDQIYTASGSVHRISRMSSYKSSNNKILNVTGTFPTHCTSDHKFFAKKFLYMGWKGVLHYSEPGFYPLSELKKEDRIALPFLDISKNSRNWIDSDTAYAIGVYLADGYINGNTVTITPGYDKDGFYKNILNKAGLTFNERPMRTSARYEILRSRSDINERFFKVCQSCGHGAYNKHFPPITFSSHEYIVREIMRGYEEADGYSGENGKVKVNTVSPRLAHDYMLLLRSMGEYPTCYFNKRSDTTMVIEGRTVNVKDRYEIYYNPADKNSHFMFKLDPDYPIMWAGIRSIEDDVEEYKVYCPTVVPIREDDPEEHTIITNGLASSNCGGLGSMLSLRPNGQFYPCIRYMPTSVGDDVPDLCIGHVDTGIIGRDQDSEVLGMMDRITRRTQSNDICYDCPLSNDCAWCSALSHTVYGTPGKRPMFICIQMIAEALANVYYWNLLNIKHPEYELGVRKNNVPDEWSLLVIDQEELNFLKDIESYSMIITMENSK